MFSTQSVVVRSTTTCIICQSTTIHITVILDDRVGKQAHSSRKTTPQLLAQRLVRNEPLRQGTILGRLPVHIHTNLGHMTQNKIRYQPSKHHTTPRVEMRLISAV